MTMPSEDKTMATCLRHLQYYDPTIGEYCPYCGRSGLVEMHLHSDGTSDAPRRAGESTGDPPSRIIRCPCDTGDAQRRVGESTADYPHKHECIPLDCNSTIPICKICGRVLMKDYSSTTLVINPVSKGK